MNWQHILQTQGSMGHCVEPGNVSPRKGTRAKVQKAPIILN